jgi:hypothetical protein
MEPKKRIKYIILSFTILISGCSKDNQQSSSEQPEINRQTANDLPISDLLRAIDLRWWNISIPDGYELKKGDVLQIDLLDSNGIIRSLGGGSVDAENPVRFVVWKQPDSEKLILSIVDSSGAHRVVIDSTPLSKDIRSRPSGETVNVGDILIKGRSTNLSTEERNQNAHNGANTNTLLKGEVGLSLRIERL